MPHRPSSVDWILESSYHFSRPSPEQGVPSRSGSPLPPAKSACTIHVKRRRTLVRRVNERKKLAEAAAKEVRGVERKVADWHPYKRIFGLLASLENDDMAKVYWARCRWITKPIHRHVQLHLQTILIPSQLEKNVSKAEFLPNPYLRIWGEFLL